MGPEYVAAAEAGAEAVGAGTAGAAGTASWLTPAVSASLLAGGTAAQMLAAQQQRKQQQAILGRALDRQETGQQDATGQVLAEGAKTAPGALAQAMQQAQTAAAARTMSDLKGAGADIIDTAGGQGAVSDAFTKAKATRTANEAGRLSTMADQDAAVRSTGQAMTDATLRRAALAERLGSMGADNRARAQASQLDAQNVDTPWYGDAGQLASLVGGIGLMGGGAGAGAAGGSAVSGMDLAADAAVGAGNNVGTAAGMYPTASASASAAGGASSVAQRAALAQALGTYASKRRQPQQSTQWMGR